MAKLQQRLNPHWTGWLLCGIARVGGGILAAQMDDVGDAADGKVHWLDQ